MNTVAEAHAAQRCEGAKRRAADIKKRHVENLTRLPTKRMATACWAFIVAKSTLREAAPILDFCALLSSNIEFHTQDIHKALWITWG
ncbi:MAG TPA: hypothetical protein PLG92_02655 [Piscinibacter sp.]|jgi:hypothetical protein|uniref:hypothetical protein n=1 Tax=Piscinibacter sp. TaxID=1903157 RepID=UPI002C6DEF4E|nr:hypothetical protein [Piscinibacter sp.]HNK17255.1 hypothetical protein [Piscinibacter sp.]